MHDQFKPKSTQPEGTPLFLFTIALPRYDNKGKSLDDAHDAFRQIAESLIGGYTQHFIAIGHWFDEKTGTSHHDEMVPYEFATQEMAKYKPLLVDLAFDLFPDQKAIFVSHAGVAEIIRRGTTVRPTPDKAHAAKPKNDFEPFAVTRAKVIQERAEDRRTQLSQATWALSEALRHWRENQNAGDAASLLLAVEEASNNIPL